MESPQVRSFWHELIEKSWLKKNVLWLSGVRRSGKTVLCKSLHDVQYFDFELPRTRRSWQDDPEAMWNSLAGSRVVLDEIHRLDNAAEILKIAADYFPQIRVIATGSSMLDASAKFKDTLTGRKLNIFLTPMNTFDLRDFKNISFEHRLWAGGLPPFFLAPALDHAAYQDWLDSYWAKDIQELFYLREKSPFTRFIELLFLTSGGIFEASRFSADCSVSQPTIAKYLSILERTFLAYVIRPFSSRKNAEIVKAPKVYAFDTGFVRFINGWQEARSEDLGILWEHLVLTEILSRAQNITLQYWRDKRGHEIDFVYKPRSVKAGVIAIECKWRQKKFDAKNIVIFRGHYPQGRNIVICSDVDRPFKQKVDGQILEFYGLDAPNWVESLVG